MKPSLALLLCSLLIGWLLVREFRRRSSLSAALWLPTLVLFILASRGVNEWLAGGSVSSGEPAQASTPDAVFYFFVILSSFVVASLRGVKWGRLIAGNWTIAILHFYFALSVLWSDDPVGSFKRWTKVLGLVIVISVIFSEKNWREAVRAVYVRCACILLPLSVLFIRYYPSLGRSFSTAGAQEFGGVTTQKNSLGEIVMIFCLFLVWDYFEVRRATQKSDRAALPWDYLLLILMGLWLLKTCDSKAALLCLLIGVTLIAVGRPLASAGANRALLLLAFVTPFLLIFATEFGSVIAPIVGAFGRDLTFTGRTNIWHAILTGHMVNPVFGAGFFNFWGSPSAKQIAEDLQAVSRVPSAHNGYLDIFLDGGIIGIALLCYVLIVRGSRLARDGNISLFQRMRFSFLIIAIFYNLSESNFLRMTPTWFTTILMLTDFSTTSNSARQGTDVDIPRDLHSVLPRSPSRISMKGVVNL